MSNIKQKNSTEIYHFACNIAVTIDVIGGKWKGIIVYHLLDGAKRFNELRRTMGNITQRMLTLQLRELERDGIIHREIYREIPPKVEYSLTPLGDSLRPVMSLMRDWGEDNKQEVINNRIANTQTVMAEE